MQVTRNVLKKFGTVAAGAVSALALVPAHAAVDVAPLVTEIEGATGPIGLVALAVMGVLVALLTFALIRRALRG